MKYILILLSFFMIVSCCSIAKTICSECKIKYPTEIIIIKKSIIAKECGFEPEQPIVKPVFYYDENKKTSFVISQQIISNNEYHEMKNAIISNYENKIDKYKKCIISTQQILNENHEKELKEKLKFYKNNVEYSITVEGD